MSGDVTLRPLNSLWVGPRLGYLEQLCLRSAVAAGHVFRLYSYTPDELAGVPPGVEVRDAAEVMPPEALLFSADSGFVALDADFWRYRLLEKGLGYWVDMDLVFLRALDFDQPYVFGWQDSKTINNALLAAPKDSAFTRDLLQVPQPNRPPPWYGPRRRALFWWKRLRSGYVGLADMPWGTYGPELVTHLVRKHKLEQFAQQPPVFYPVSWHDAQMLYESSEKVEQLLAPETRAIHLWHGRLGELARRAPPRGSFIAEMCDRFGVDGSAPG